MVDTTVTLPLSALHTKIFLLIFRNVWHFQVYRRNKKAARILSLCQKIAYWCSDHNWLIYMVSCMKKPCLLKLNWIGGNLRFARAKWRKRFLKIILNTCTSKREVERKLFRNEESFLLFMKVNQEDSNVKHVCPEWLYWEDHFL